METEVQVQPECGFSVDAILGEIKFRNENGWKLVSWEWIANDKVKLRFESWP